MMASITLKCETESVQLCFYKIKHKAKRTMLIFVQYKQHTV